MDRESFSARSCSKGDLTVPQCSFDAGLSEGGQLWNTGVAVATVENSERKVDFEKAFFPTLREPTLDVDRSTLSERRAGHIHHPDTVVALVGS